MNLEDYAYNEDGRWYINPQVSLDEQNEFINNIRNIEAQNNSEIEQQTRGLGTQVPSQLGGLVGGGSYFRTRYQTPKTNQTIAELRTVAQASALETALKNEIAKKQKQYKDAYRAASTRNANQNSTSDDTPILDSIGNKLNINVETSGNEELPVSDDEVTEGDVGYNDETGATYWMSPDGKKYEVFTPSAGEKAQIGIAKAVDGNIITRNGKRYVFIADKNAWFKLGEEIDG